MNFFYFVLEKTLFCFAVQVHRACAEREILDKLDHPFLPALYASFQVRKLPTFSTLSTADRTQLLSAVKTTDC